jgi:hypothetical protein
MPLGVTRGNAPYTETNKADERSLRLIAPRPDDSVSAELASQLYVSHGRQREHATKLDLTGASNLVRTGKERSKAARLEIPASSACFPCLSENY